MNSKRTVLVVDDEPNACAYLKDLLEYFGYEVALAHSCTGTIGQLKQRAYDCLLLDHYLKDECTDSVLIWLRAMERREPVVMMCATVNYESRVELLMKGAGDVIAKPVQPTQLRQIMQKLLEPAPATPPRPVGLRARLSRAL